MGKPTDRLPAYRDDPSYDDAVSLHTTAADDDIPDIANSTLAQPPAYTDDEEDESQPLVSNPYAVHLAGGTVVKTVNGVDHFFHADLDNDAAVLETFVRRWALIPPAKLVQIVGTHKQTTKVGNKNETKTITDFDLKLRLTEYLLTHSGQSAWSDLRPAENEDKTYRGTILKKRALASPTSLEDGSPGWQEWCRRFCADPAKLKTFRFSREVTGLNQKLIEEKLTSLLRGTNYRGRIAITFPTENAGIELYSDHRFNRWRNNSWIVMLSVISMMWIFTWPYLFFSTKRYAVVKTVWPFSKPGDNGRTLYASMSETQWLNRWQKTIEKAALEKRQDTLIEDDLARQNEPVQQFSSGNSGLDSAVNLVGAGIRVFNDVNRQLGWGGDC